MRRALLFFTLILVFGYASTPVYAQYKVEGKVCEKDSGKPLDGINVMLSNPRTLSIVAFSLSEQDGTYALTTDSSLDSLLLSITGFNVEPIKQLIAKGSHQIDFSLRQTHLNIRESKIKADPIKRTGDTLTYYVEAFRDETDRSIGQVLRKMPGIEVSEGGGVKYMGTPINRFYIEGLDMLGGKYGIATNSVQADDIAAVEIYENHQPIKVLERREWSQQAALNLKLKEGARGTWNGTVEAGMGYRPFLWDIRIAPMYFSRSFQSILTYKTNNMGDDVSRELSPLFGGGGRIPSLIDIRRPSKPGLDENLWLRNNIHAGSANAIVKVSNEADFTIKAHYFRDIQDAESQAQTTYYLVDAPSFSVSEEITSQAIVSNLQVDAQFRHNGVKKYLHDKISLEAEQENALGTVTEGNRLLDQQTKLPFISGTNELLYSRTFGKWLVNARSHTTYGQRNSFLSVTENHAEGVRQDITSRKFLSTNSASTSYNLGHWNTGIGMRAVFDAEEFNSFLGETDSLRNDMSWHRFDLAVSPSVSYESGSTFILDLSCPLNAVWINLVDRIRGSSDHPSFLLISPSLSVKYTLTASSSLRASASHSRSLSGLYDTYEGYVMRNYRQLVSRGGHINSVRNTMASLELSCSDVVHALFVGATASAWTSNSDYSFGAIYQGSLIKNIMYRIPNRSSGLQMSLNGNKRFHALSTTLNASVSWTRSWNNYYRQEQLMNARSDNLTIRGSITSRVAKPLLIQYDGEWTGYLTTLSGNGAISPIHAARQELGIHWIIGKYATFKIRGRHFYNSHVDGAGRNMFFLDSSISHITTRGTELILEGNNLLNSSHFLTSSFGTNTFYESRYKLRPISVIFKIRFSIR